VRTHGLLLLIVIGNTCRNSFLLLWLVYRRGLRLPLQCPGHTQRATSSLLPVHTHGVRSNSSACRRSGTLSRILHSFINTFGSSLPRDALTGSSFGSSLPRDALTGSLFLRFQAGAHSTASSSSLTRSIRHTDRLLLVWRQTPLFPSACSRSLLLSPSAFIRRSRMLLRIHRIDRTSTRHIPSIGTQPIFLSSARSRSFRSRRSTIIVDSPDNFYIMLDD